MCYAGAVFRRFVIDKNHYFECFQALNCDNLVQSNVHLCNNDNKVSFKKSMNLLFKGANVKKCPKPVHYLGRNAN